MQLELNCLLLDALTTGRQATTGELVVKIDERTKRLAPRHGIQVQLQFERAGSF